MVSRDISSSPIVSKFEGTVVPEIQHFPAQGLESVAPEMLHTGAVKFDVAKNVVHLSDNIPVKWQKYVALHEKCCVPHIGTSDHCLDATVYEISQVPQSDRAEYLLFRIPFLQNLAKYIARMAPTDEYYAKLLPEIEASIARLILEQARCTTPESI